MPLAHAYNSMMTGDDATAMPGGCLENHTMRDDMHRALVTRPRLGGKVRRKGRARRFEDMPKLVGMKRTHALAKADMKMLNEYLQPLRRYLHAQVGRPWETRCGRRSRRVCG